MMHRRHSEQAFSLVESILAMTILGITVAAILTTFSSALIAGRISEDQALVSTMMIELHAHVRSNLFDPTQINQGTFTDHPGFTWQATYLLTNVTNLYQVTLQIQWERGGRVRSMEYMTYHYYDLEAELEALLEESV